MPDYKNTGILFHNDRKKTDKYPDFSGECELDADVVRHLIANGKAGKPMKLRIAGWKKQGGKGPFISLKLEPPREQQPQPERSFDTTDDPPW
jgi:hypothetical protein